MTTRRRSVETLSQWVREHEHPGRSARLRVRMPVEIEQCGRVISGRIVDISPTGLRITAVEPIDPGEALRLACLGEWHSAEIKWVEGLEFGANLKERAKPS
jgi:hypothetical protein